MRLAGRPRGSELYLEPGEAQLLDRLFADLDEVVAEHDDDDVGRRLYPDAVPDDPQASAQFGELTHEALRTGRHERIAACRADLDALPVRLADDDVARRWLQVLNDLRLVLGTRLGVTEDGIRAPADPDDDAAIAPYAVYDYLTGVQDLVVRALLDR